MLFKVVRLILIAFVLSTLQPVRGAAAATLDYGIPNGHFYTQASGYPAGTSTKGYSITDDEGIPFWSEFSRLGGVNELGYPISRRFVWGGFVHQATQKAVMQWRPDANRVWFANVFDVMGASGKNNWLQVVRQTPPPFDTSPDNGLSWDQIKDRHWKLLDANEAIRRRYWSDSDPLNHYGLPMSYAEWSNVFVVRTQRAVFQYWKVNVPWAKAGMVTVANGGDIAKEAGVFPVSATTPERGALDSAIRWAYYVSYDKKSLDSLKANIGKLDYVSPFYFSVDAQGNIQDTDEAAVTKLIKDNKVKILPTVRNSPQYDAFRLLLSSATIRTRIIDQILALIDKHGYDGINIDFEGMSGSDRQLLSDFMAALADRMRPRGKIVSMAVAAKEQDRETGWAAPYDYASLGRSNDLVLVMAYGYRTGVSTLPGSTAPTGWVESSMAYAASQIPPGKLLLGIAWYGYDWNKTSGPPARALRYSDAIETAQQNGATIRYSETDQTAYFTYVKDAQAHEAWFEDVRSFKSKIALVDKYELAGWGGWRLGQEDPAIWEAFR